MTPDMPFQQRRKGGAFSYFTGTTVSVRGEPLTSSAIENEEQPCQTGRDKCRLLLPHHRNESKGRVTTLIDSAFV